MRSFISLAFLLTGSSFALDSSTFHADDIITRDVAIIGGGAAGTYAAISLKDKGASIAVIEKKARLGGHTETYTSPTGVAIDYGVQVWHNTTIVRDFFKRFEVALTVTSFSGSLSENFDLSTGAHVNITQSTDEAVGAALTKYAGLLSQYPQLDRGMFLPSPVPQDLVSPFGEFVTKYGLQDAVRRMYTINPGLGNILTVPTVENIRVFGLDLVTQILQDSLLTTARRNNSELYGKATAELKLVNSLLLESEVTASKRSESGVELVVKTPQGKKLICAKKLLVTIPARTDFLQPFDLDAKERDVFGKLINAGYYVALVENSGVPDNLSIWNYAQDSPYNLPTLPSIYTITPSAVPGLKIVYYGSPRSQATFPLTDDAVKSDIIDSIKRLQTTNPQAFKQTEPKILLYSSHTPFYLQARPEDTAAGFYDRLYALQGSKSTYWSGATFRAQDSSMIWRYTEEEVLPKLLKSL